MGSSLKTKVKRHPPQPARILVLQGVLGDPVSPSGGPGASAPLSFRLVGSLGIGSRISFDGSCYLPMDGSGGGASHLLGTRGMHGPFNPWALKISGGLTRAWASKAMTPLRLLPIATLSCREPILLCGQGSHEDRNALRLSGGHQMVALEPLFLAWCQCQQEALLLVGVFLERGVLAA